jgi:hypothetical protein
VPGGRPAGVRRAVATSASGTPVVRVSLHNSGYWLSRFVAGKGLPPFGVLFCLYRCKPFAKASKWARFPRACHLLIVVRLPAAAGGLLEVAGGRPGAHRIMLARLPGRARGRRRGGPGGLLASLCGSYLVRSSSPWWLSTLFTVARLPLLLVVRWRVRCRGLCFGLARLQTVAFALHSAVIVWRFRIIGLRCASRCWGGGARLAGAVQGPAGGGGSAAPRCYAPACGSVEDYFTR